MKIYNGQSAAEAGTTTLPAVFTAPIRRDIVHFVHLNMAKNKCVADLWEEGGGMAACKFVTWYLLAGRCGSGLWGR